MAHVNTDSVARQLQAMGFSALGAQQLITGQVVSNAKDRRRLALFLAGLFEAKSIRSTNSGNGSTITTQSGIVLELQEDAGTHERSSAGKSSTGQGTISATRTRGGIVVRFEDES